MIRLIKQKSSDFTENEKLLVFSFDEVCTSNHIDIDKELVQRIGPHCACQVIMARGLVSNWKQPIYYVFDQPMKRKILEEIISTLFFAGFVVVAMVSDMGTSNQALWSALNINYKTNCFFSIHQITLYTFSCLLMYLIY